MVTFSLIELVVVGLLIFIAISGMGVKIYKKEYCQYCGYKLGSAKECPKCGQKVA